MKTDELKELGLSQEQITAVFKINGLDIENAKAVKDKEITALTIERDDLKTRLGTAEETLKKFEGIDPEQIQQEIQTYQQRAENAEKEYTAKLTQRDQQDWLKARLDEYGVESPYARKQLAAEIMAADGGLPWKEGAFLGFDDFMKSAKEKDKGLYQTAEERAEAEKAAQLKEKAPAFTGPTGDPAPASGKFTPPKIF